jgi:hypothetical protein
MDALEARGWFLNRINNGFPSERDPDHYANVAAELWFELGKAIQSKRVVLPNDQLLRGQLLNRKQVVNKKGKLAAESKDDMKKRGAPSPDRGDAVAMCCAPTGGFGEAPITWALPVACGSYQIMEPSGA